MGEPGKYSANWQEQHFVSSLSFFEEKMKKAKEFTKEVKEIVKQERKIHVREIGKNEKSYHKYKLSNDYTVQ